MILFGQLFTIPEVMKIMNEDWKVPFSNRKLLSAFKRDNAASIEEAREEYTKSYIDVRLGVKRSRLEELTYLYNAMKAKFGKKQGNHEYRLLLQTLEQIRKEAEGDHLTIDGKVDVKYEANLQEHLRNEIFKTLNIKEIILARVAARMGISSVKLIHSINKSYYRQFSNVLGDLDHEEAASLEMIFPSQDSYDFERIRKAQPQWDNLVEDVVSEDDATYTEAKTTQAVAIKDRLREKIAKKSERAKGASAKQKVSTESGGDEIKMMKNVETLEAGEKSTKPKVIKVKKGVRKVKKT